MKDFYTKLHQVFETEENKDKYRTKGIPAIRHIDFYAGQDFSPEYFEANLFPALFFNYTIDYNAEPAVATLTFRLCYEQLRDLSSRATEMSKNEGLKFLDCIDITDEVLKTLETPLTGKLNLINEQQQIEDTVVDVHILTYTCSYCGKEKSPSKDYLQGQVERLSLDDKIGLFQKLND